MKGSATLSNQARYLPGPKLPINRAGAKKLRESTPDQMSFNYVLPTTGAFSFTSCIPSPPTRLQGALAEASAQRGRLRDILKRLKRADDKETLAVIKVCLPSRL